MGIGRVSTLRLLVFRYKDLHLFQLEHPTKIIEWTGDKSKSSLNESMKHVTYTVKKENTLKAVFSFMFQVFVLQDTLEQKVKS